MTASSPPAPGFADLYRSFALPVVRYMRVALGDVVEAEDAAHHVFLRAYMALRSGVVPVERERWLFTLARNTVIDQQRRRGRVVLSEPAAMARLLEEGEGAAADPRLDWVSRPDVRAALDRLPRRQHEVVVLRYVLGCSHAEAARVLGSSEGAVRKAHHLALRSLAREVAPGEAPAVGRRRSQAMRALLLPRRLSLGGFSLLGSARL